MEVFQAYLDHLEEVSQLFDKYRVFYKASSDPGAASQFLQERLQKGESVIFVASNGEKIVGFTQLYPGFSSVSMRRIWTLNDLFVEPAFRKQGVGSLLMSAAEEFVRETGAVRIVLATQIANTTAQSLYESRGYRKDEEFYHYALSV